jgi:hypothetical protein
LAALAALAAAPGPARAGPAPPGAPGRYAAAAGTVHPAPEVSICQQGATHLLIDARGTVVYQLGGAGPAVDLGRHEGEWVLVVGTVRGGPVEGCPLLLAVHEVVPLGGGAARRGA